MSEDRKPEDYKQAAEDNLLLAQALVGQAQISDQEFLERMAQRRHGGP